MRRSRGLMALVLVAASAADAWAGRLDVVVPLGGAAESSVAAPGGRATIGFLATQGPGRKLVLLVKRAKGSTLAPDVVLIAPDGAEFDVAANGGSVARGATSWKAKLLDVPQTGLWRIEVRGADDSVGRFSVSVAGRDASKTTGEASIPVVGTTDVKFVAGDGVAASVAVKRANGSLVVPRVVVLDPSGAPLDGATVSANPKTGALSIKGLRLPLFGKYTLRFAATTGAGGSVSYSISTAPLKPKGALPVADAGAATDAEPGVPGRLDGSASRSTSGASLKYRWAQVSGPAAQLTDAGTATPAFTPPEGAGSLAFQLAVLENGVASKSSTIGVEVGRRPLADAGRSRSVASSATVTLDGSGSVDRGGAGLRYAWRALPGDAETATLAGADTPSPSFTAPPGAHEFRFGLTVDDGNVRSFEDVVVIVAGDPSRSVADAGRGQYVRPSADTHLCALASRTASGVLDAPIRWTQVEGPAVVLEGATTPWPSFTAPAAAADLVFEAAVGDGSGAADRVDVHVRSDVTNLPPSTRASAAAVAAPGPTPLAAVGTSDPDADAPTFQWAQVAGAAAPLTGATSSTASAALPVGSDQYVFAVQPNDGLAYGAADLASVRSAGYAGRPIAAAGGDRSAAPGIVVTLDGNGSVRTDGGGAPLTFQWTQIGGGDWFDVAAEVPTFDAASARPSFALPIDASSSCPTKTLVFQLVVADGANASLPDLATVTFTGVPTNGKPSATADVSDPNPVVGETVTLFGAVKDADGDALIARWRQTSGPTVQLLPDVNALSPAFVAPDQGAMTFQITADDGHWESAPASVGVTVDRKPVAAIAVSPSSGGVGTQVTMDGAGSTDPEGHALTYAWTQTAGASVAFAQGASSVQFAAPSGAVTFRLVVRDGRQDSDPKTATFTSALPTPTPSSNAPSGKAAYGASVALTANPGPGGPFTYVWRQINAGGTDPAVTLSSTTAQNPTFTVPAPTTAAFGSAPSATFGVVASDGTRTSPEGVVTVSFYASFNATSTTSTTVYSIITANCVSCHSGSSNTCPIYSGYEYGMGSAAAFLSNSRGANSCSSSKQRLPAAGVTGQSSNSFLLDRLKGISSSTMPPFGSLSGAQIRLVQDWIDQGCQNN